MGFDIDGARKAGYSDDEIADHLAAQQNFDIKGARKAGYSSADVLAHLAKATPPPPPAPSGSMLDGGPSFESLASAPAPAPLEALKPTTSPRPAPAAPSVQPQGRSMGISFTPAPPAPDPDTVLDRKGPDAYQPTAADRAASAEWDSLSPQGQEKALAAMRFETGQRNAPNLSAPADRGFVERALDSTVRKPMDRSATGALLESAGDAARGVLKASNNLGQSAWGGVQAAADAVGAGRLSDLAGEATKAAEGNSDRLTNKADPESLTSKVFESTFTSVPLVLGVPGAPIRAIMGQSAAQEYGQSRARGLDPSASAERAVWFGLAEGIGERFGLPQLQHLFARAAQQATGKELGHILADMLVKEQIGEQVTTALQSGYDKFGTYGQKPNATLADYLNDVADTAKVTLGQSLLSGGLAGGVKRVARGNSNAHALAGALDADIHETPEEALNRAIDASPYGIARQAGFHVDPPLATDSPLDRRKKTENLFRNAAATVGMSPAAVDAAVKAAQTRPLDQVAGFFQRFAKSARDQGLAGGELDPAVNAALGHGPLDAKPQLRQVPPEAFALLDDGTGLADEPQAPAAAPEPAPAAAPAAAPEQAPTPTVVDERAHAAATSPTNDLAEPTDAQKEAGNYQKGHVRIGGLDLAIENPQGSVRRGVDRDGKAWESTLASHYGYIKGTVGNDKDHVDAFVKPGTPPDYSGPVFVVDQVHPDNGKFDEHKVVIGAADEAEAEAIYRANYAKDWKGLAGITRLPMQAFKSWVRDGTKKQPLADLPGARTVTAEPAPVAPPAAPAAPRFQTTTNADGTVLVHGAPDAIKQALPEFKGVTGKRGVTYGKRSAQAVLQALEKAHEPKQSQQPQAAAAPEAQPAPAAEGSAAAAGPAAAPAGVPAAGPAAAQASGVKGAEHASAHGFEPVTKFDRVSVGPGGFIKPRPVAPGKHTYRETDVSGLDQLMREDRQAVPFNAFVADNPDLAIGQGFNRGVHIVFRPDSVGGREHVKPMTGDLAGREYKAELLAPRAVQTVTMSAKDAEKLRGLTKMRMREQFDREDMPGGRVRFHRKGLDRLSPSDPDAPRAQAPAARASKKATRPKLDPERDTLLQAVAKMGGLARDEVAREFGMKPEELKSTVQVGNLRGYPFRKTGGMSVDAMAEQLREAGYFDGVPDDEIRRAFEAAIFDELGGRPRLSTAGEMRSAEQQAADARDQQAAPDLTDAEQAEWEALTRKAGIEPAAMDSLEGDDIPGFDDNFESDPRALAAFLGETYDEATHDQQARQDANGRPAQADAQEDRSDAARGTRAPAEAGSEAPGRVPAAEDLTLSSPTSEDLRAQADRATQARAADQAEQKRLTDKAKADAQRDEFTLTGSDSSADVAAAAGQGGLFDAPPTGSKKAERLTDAGEELIRNRRGKLKGLAWDDVSTMNDTLKVAQVVKANVWPRPDYAKMVEEGAPAWKAAVLKAVYDKIAAAPVTRAAPTDDDLRAYIETLHKTREALGAELDRVGKLGGTDDLWRTMKSENVFGKVFPVPADARPAYGRPSPFDRNSQGGKDNNRRAALIGGNGPVMAMQFGSRTLSKVKDLLSEGFPAKQEAWQKSFEVRPLLTRDGDVPQAERTGEPQERYYVYEKGSTWRLAKGMQDGGFASREQAEAFARTLVTRKRETLPPSRGLDLADVTRSGPDWRGGKDVTADQVMKHFGFRGVNLGEYVKAKQEIAQVHLNHAFDAFNDLADLLGVPPKAMSLNGTLGLAIGAQGSGKALAHFAPGVNEINITRDSGAGALAHEFGHALDHYFATQHGRAAAMGKRPYLSAVVETMRDAGEVRPEVMDAMRAVMKAMNTRPMTEAEARKFMEDQRALNQRRLDRWVTEFKGNRGADAAALDAVAQKLSRGEVDEANLAEFTRAAGLKPGNTLAGNALSVAFRLRDLADEANFLKHHIPQVETDYAKASAALDAKKQGDGYWSTPWEKFARAFETYVMDALKDRERESLYLSGLVDGKGWKEWAENTGKQIPFPAGAERLSIQQAFQTLVDAIDSKQTDKGVALFSLRDDGETSHAETHATPSTDPDAVRTAARVQGFVDHATGRPGEHRVVPVDGAAASPELRSAQALARGIFGHQVQFVRLSNGPLFHGLTMPGQAGGKSTVVIDVGTPKPVMAVLGHELLHTLRASHPELYDDLKARLDKVMKSNAPYAKQLNARRAQRGLGPLNDDVLAEERIADVVGDQFTEPAFWRDLARTNAKGFRRVADAILSFIDDVLAKVIKRRPFGSDAYVKDMKAARAAVVDAMSEFSRSQAASSTAAEARMSIRDGAKVTLDEDGNPAFENDRVRVAYPIETDRVEVIPEAGQKVLSYAIMPATGFDVLGRVDLLVQDGKPVSLLDIEVDKGSRKQGTDRAAVEAILAGTDGDLNISNIVTEARGFWDKLGVPEQNLPDGHAYDGTLNADSYRQGTGDDASGVRAVAREAAGGEAPGDRGSDRQADAGAEGGRNEAPGRGQADEEGRFSLADKTLEQREALARAGIGPGPSLKTRIRLAYGRAVDLLRSRAALTDEFRQGALDQFHGIKRAVERDLGALGVDQDPYIAARLANGGTSSVMRALLLHGQAQWAENGQHLEKVPDSKGLLDILAPLGDDVSDFFGWMVGNRAARLMKEGREHNFTVDQIKTLQDLAGDRRAEFVKIAAEYSAFKRSVLDIAEGAGLINPEGRKAWDHADYIPFYRKVDEKSTFSPTGRKGLAGQSSGIRTLKGGEAALNDPVENLLMNFSRLVDASLKNNAIRKTIDKLEEGGSVAVEKVGYDMAGAIIPTSQVKQLLIDAGAPASALAAVPPEAFAGMAKMWAIQAPSDPDVVRVMRDGKPQFYRVADPLLLRALTSFVPFNFPGLGAMRAFKRLLTATVTSTPDFMLRNFIRDTAATAAITRDGFNPVKSLTGIGKSFSEAGGYEDMLFAGASFQSGNINAADPTGTATAVRRALRSRGMDASSANRFMATLLDTPAKFWEKYRHIGESIENANREAVFEAASKAGRGTTAAAFEAKDLMDFNLRGGWAAYQLLADVLPFFNARVQGLYRLGRADPKRLATVGVLMMAASAMLAFANDGEDWYDELPDWDKDTYWHFRIGQQHFRVPKPFELGVLFATIPERLGRSIKGLDTGKKTLSRVWANIRDQLAFDPVPQVLRPGLNVALNHDSFRDSPIENLGDQGKLPHARYNARTSDTMRVLAGAAAPVADATGLSPKRLEYLVNGYLGTVGSYALGFADMVVRNLEGKPPGPTLRADDLPMVKSFYRVDPARSTVYESDLYKLREEADQVAKTLRAHAKEGDKPAVEKLKKDSADVLKVGPVVDSAAQKLAEMTKARDAITADPKLTPEEKRAKIDALQVQRNALAKKVMTAPAVRATQ